MGYRSIRPPRRGRYYAVPSPGPSIRLRTINDSPGRLGWQFVTRFSVENVGGIFVFGPNRVCTDAR